MHIDLLQCIHDHSCAYVRCKLRVLNKATLQTFPSVHRSYKLGNGRHQRAFRKLQGQLCTLVNGFSWPSISLVYHDNNLRHVLIVWQHMLNMYSQNSWSNVSNTSFETKSVASHFATYLRNHPCILSEWTALCTVPGSRVTEGILDRYIEYARGIMKSFRKTCKHLGHFFPGEAEISNASRRTRMHMKLYRKQFIYTRG